LRQALVVGTALLLLGSTCDASDERVLRPYRPRATRHLALDERGRPYALWLRKDGIVVGSLAELAG
jgi:hypothetical protein